MIHNPHRGVIMSDVDGSIIVINRTARRWLGFGEDEVVNHLPDVSALFAPESLTAEAARLTLKLGQSTMPGFQALVKEARQGYSEPRDLSLVRKDNSCFTASVTVTPCHDGNNDVAGYFFALTDISERLIQREILNESEERYRTVVEVMEEGILLQDVTGMVLTCNASAERMLGLTMEQMNDPHLTANPWTAIQEDFTPFPPSRYPLAVTLSTGKPCTQVVMGMRQADGSVKWLSINSVPLFRNGDEKPHAVMMSFTDITERMEIEAELARARDAAVEGAQAKASFLANSSHEIRTPLNAIIGMLGLLRDTELTTQQRGFVENSQSSAEVLLTIINDLLDLSKIEAGKYAIEVNELSVRNVVEEAVESVATRAYAKSVEVLSFVSQGVPELLMGDEVRLRQVVTNLLSNAVKFTDEGEIVVRVTVERETDLDAVLKFAISDSGIGMEDEFLQQVFEPFRQAAGPQGRRGSGTGLGLAISKQFVELMGGEIGVTSTPGHGSDFVFTVRLQKPAGDKNGHPRPPEVTHVSRVMVIVGHKGLRESLGHVLRDCGLEPVLFEGVAPALKVLLNNRWRSRYDAILVDDNYLDLDLSTLWDVLQEEFGEVMPYLVRITSPHLTVSGNPVRVDAVLTKPLRRSALVKTLNGLSRAGREIPETQDDAPVDDAQTNYSDIQILVVEDNDLNRQVALHQLQSLGCTPDLAYDGLEALEMMDKKQYEVIFMDCQMPVFDGYQTTTEIRRRESQDPGERPGVHIVALTAYALTGDREKCLSVGMNDYLSKPVRPDQLQGALDRYLGLGSHPQPAPSHDLVLSDVPAEILDEAKLKELAATSPPGVFRELVRMFCTTAPVQLDGIATWFDEGNWDGVARQAHILGGSCSHFGAYKLMQTCLELERSAQGTRRAAAGELVVSIRDQLVQVVYHLNQLSQQEAEVPKSDS